MRIILALTVWLMAATIRLIGDDVDEPCVDGTSRTYLSLDSAASTGAFPSVGARVNDAAAPDTLTSGGMGRHVGVPRAIEQEAQ